MKLNIKITSIFMMLGILLYFSSFDDVLGSHTIGDDVIHKNLYKLEVKSSPPGLEIAGSGTYEEGTWVKTIAAKLEWGAYEFVRWTVNGAWVDGNPYTVLMDKDRTVVAVYSLHPVKKQNSISVETNSKTKFDLTIISPYGKTIGTGSYVNGTSVDFSVSEQFVNDEIHDGVRYAFSGWSDGNTPNLMSNIIKTNGTEIIIAKWSKQYRLEIVDSEDKTNIINSSWHAEKSIAPLIINNIQTQSNSQVKQTINSWVSIGSNFAVIKEPTNSITSLAMDNPYKISIDWKNQFYLNANSAYGKVEGSGWYDEGDVVTTSIDAQTYDTGIVGTRLIFDGWFGDVNSPGMNIQVPMDEPKSIEGIWKKQFLLTVNSDHGLPSGGGWYNEGEVATFGTNLPRDPAGMWQQQVFHGWSGDADSTSYTGSILMNGPKTVTATWDVDFAVGFLNVAIISIAVIGGLFMYKKSKKGSKQEKISKKDNDENLITKPKKYPFSILSEIFSSKTIPQINNEEEQEIVQTKKPGKSPQTVNISQENIPQHTVQVENSLDKTEPQKNDLVVKTKEFENEIMEIELEKKRSMIKLENDLAEVQLQKNDLSQKDEQLEKNLAEVELQKKNLLQKTAKLEENIAENELEKKSIAEVELLKKNFLVDLERKAHSIELERKEIDIELEKRTSKIELQKNDISQKAEQLEKNLAEVELQKKNLLQKTAKLEENIAENELEKKRSMIKLENDLAEVQLQKNTIVHEKEHLEKSLAEVELQKKNVLVDLERKAHSIELERKEIDIELEKRTSKIELQKNGISQKAEQLEKNLAEVELQKKNLLQKTAKLEENIAENELEKKRISQEKEQLKKNLLVEVQLQKNISSDELRKNFFAIELQKKVTSQRMNDLDKTIFEFQLEKKKITSELERKESEIEFEKKKQKQKDEQLEKNLAKVELQKNVLFEKSEQLEKSIAETQLQKKKTSVDLEKRQVEIELDKKKMLIKLENDLAEVQLQKNDLSQKAAKLEKSLEKVQLEKKTFSQKTKELENKITENNFEKKKIASELERTESVIEFEKKKQDQKTEQLENSLSKVQLQKKILDGNSLELEIKLSKVELEKKRLSSELERKESVIELEEKKIDQKAWELEKRIEEFARERNITILGLEKKKIIDKLQRKESLIDLEKEYLFQQKNELEKRIAAIEIENDTVPSKIEKQINSKFNNTKKSKSLDNAFANIELAREIAISELQRKESVIEFEKNDLAEKTEMLEKRIAGVESERNMSFIQIERIESEIDLEKNNLKQKINEFGENNSLKNLNLKKNCLDYSTIFNSYDEFREWASVLEDELSIKETSDGKSGQDEISGEYK